MGSKTKNRRAEKKRSQLKSVPPPRKKKIFKKRKRVSAEEEKRAGKGFMRTGKWKIRKGEGMNSGEGGEILGGKDPKQKTRKGK